MKVAKEIETSDGLRPWRWYAGALQQHSFATLILIEVSVHPHLEYAKRAWESLDWIFQVPSWVPYIHKGRWVLEGAVGVMKEYLKARKMRCPTFMDERLEIVPSRVRTPTSSVTSDTRASGPDDLTTSQNDLTTSQDDLTTSDAQPKIKHETTRKETEHVCTGRPDHSIFGLLS